MSNIERTTAVSSLIAALVLTAGSWAVVRGGPAEPSEREGTDRVLIPLGVDNTYTNYDVWVPPTCTAGPWTGFRFDFSSAGMACFGAMYDGLANPFANPPSGVTGVNGTMNAAGTVGARIDWTNTNPMAAVTAGSGSARDGHFGYQFFNSMCAASRDRPQAAWHLGTVPCPLKDTSIQLVADDSIASIADDSIDQERGAQVIVWNHSDGLDALKMAVARDTTAHVSTRGT